MWCWAIIIILLIVLFILLLSKINKKIETYQNIIPQELGIYFINLDQSQDRKNKMELEFKNHKLPVQRFPAYLGKKINYNFQNNLTQNFSVFHKRTPLYVSKKGSFGNYLSQTSCWYDFYLHSTKKYIMVMEDDIYFNSNFDIIKIHRIIDSLPEGQWDMLKLFNFGKQVGPKYNRYVYQAINDGPNRNNTGMQIYIIPRNKIPKILKEILPIQKETFDMILKRKMDTLKVFISYEKMVGTDHIQSDRKENDSA